jgi:H+/Cl- antiporter ClcA
MAAFVGVWYFYTIITYGTNVPAGLFLPGMIIGCGMGDLFFRFQNEVGYYDEAWKFINTDNE